MKFLNSISINSILQPITLSLKLNFFFGNIAFISLFIAVLLYWFDFFDTRLLSKKLKNFCMIIANISLAGLLIQRWFESGHFPLSNLYESLIGLSWGFTSVHFLLAIFNPFNRISKVTGLFNNSQLASIFESQTYKFQKDIKVSEKGTVLGYANSANQTSKQQALSPLMEQEESVRNGITSAQSILCTFSNSASSSFSPELNFYSSQPLTFTKQKEKFSVNQNPSINKDHRSDFSKVNDKIGAITAPTALLTSVFATFFLPPEITQASALIPALKSNWLTMHVTVMVASYAFLLIGSLLSITYCVFGLSSHFSEEKNKKQVLQFNLINFLKTFFNTENSINYKNQVPLLTVSNQHNKQEKASKMLTHTDKNNLNLATWLNTTSYRILGLGFPLLTIGILSGAVWANEAWGSYWSWDPKETWALITWLVFAVYFHSRYTRSSNSFVPATIASVGFVVIWICYLGVNLLGTGLHSYGWFSS